MAKKKSVPVKDAPPGIRSRIKEFRYVMASEILPNEQNWRVHPKSQMSALQEMLAKVGFAEPVVVYETPKGLKLINGHLRVGSVPANTTIPVVVLDVNETEAKMLLATIDPLTSMATENSDVLSAMVSGLDAASRKTLDKVLSESVYWGVAFPASAMTEMDEKSRDAGTIRARGEKVFVTLEMSKEGGAVFEKAVKKSRLTPGALVIRLAQTYLEGR